MRFTASVQPAVDSIQHFSLADKPCLRVAIALSAAMG
jgi:hypothetical protein